MMIPTKEVTGEGIVSKVGQCVLSEVAEKKMGVRGVYCQ